MWNGSYPFKKSWCLPLLAQWTALIFASWPTSRINFAHSLIPLSQIYLASFVCIMVSQISTVRWQFDFLFRYLSFFLCATSRVPGTSNYLGFNLVVASMETTEEDAWYLSPEQHGKIWARWTMNSDLTEPSTNCPSEVACVGKVVVTMYSYVLLHVSTKLEHIWI